MTQISSICSRFGKSGRRTSTASPFVCGEHPIGIISFSSNKIQTSVAIPPDHYFAMGDNRDNSQDSRYWGFLPATHIKGRALLVYWSYEAEREDYESEGLGASLKGIVDVVTHVFTRTRWNRLLHQTR